MTTAAHDAGERGGAIRIRPATTADAAAIRELLVEVGWFDDLAAAPADEAVARIARRIALAGADRSHALYVAARPDDTPIGYAAAHWLPYLFLDGPEGYVSELFVRAAERGHGVGTRLVAAIQPARVRALDARDPPHARVVPARLLSCARPGGARGGGQFHLPPVTAVRDSS